MPAIASSAGDITVISDRPARSMSGYAVLVGGFVLLVLAAYLGWLSFGRTSGGGLLATAIFVFCIVRLEGAVRLAAELQRRDAALRQLHRHGCNDRPALGQSVLCRHQGVAPRPDHGEREDQGERPEWEPDRDRGHPARHRHPRAALPTEGAAPRHQRPEPAASRHHLPGGPDRA